jgi:hypothetical protein
MTTTKTPILCSNEDHFRPTPAAANVSWPNGPFKPSTACMLDLRRLIADAREGGYALNIELFGSTVEQDGAQ